jgi:hypothetical protein
MDHDVDHALLLARSLDGNTADGGVRVWAPHEGDMEQSWPRDVIEIPPTSTEQPFVGLAANAAAEEFCGHRGLRARPSELVAFREPREGIVPAQSEIVQSGPIFQLRLNALPSRSPAVLG